LDQNWRGSGPREHPNKIWDPLRISATVEANNFKCGTQIGFGTRLAKTTFKTKIGGGLGQGNIQKNWDPLLITATVEASDFKFGMQWGSGLAYQKNNVYHQNWRGPGPGKHPKNIGTPCLFLQPTKKIGTQQDYLAKQVLGAN